MTLPVTVIIPTKNEKKHLPKCLKSIRSAAEIIVVDSNSEDGTQDIATEFGAKVLQFNWNGNYPKKRNWCLHNYSFKTEWILFLDADERITEDFISELERVLSNTRHNGFWIHYDNHFLGRKLKHGDSFRKLSLFKVDSGRYENIEEDHWSHLDMEVHEHPHIQGSVGRIKARLQHHDKSTISAYVDRHNAYSSWEAHRYLWLTGHRESWKDLTLRQRIKYSLANSVFLGPLYFIGAYILRGGFLDGRAGLLFTLLKTSYFWQVRAKILEFGQNKEGRE